MVKKRTRKPKVRRSKPKAKRMVKRKKRPSGKASKTMSRKAKKSPGAAHGVNLEKIGVVTHYFPRVNAAAVKILKDSLKVGERIYIKGHTTDFKEKVGSMQLDHVPVNEGKKAQEIGLLVKLRVRIGDSVYRL